MKVKALFGETISCGSDRDGHFFVRVDRDDFSPIGVLDRRGALELRNELSAYLKQPAAAQEDTP